MQLGSLRRQLTSLFVLLIAAQALVLAVLYSRIKHFAELRSELAHRQELRAELYSLRLAALDAETGERGFVITDREDFLQPYRAAVLTFKSRLERLRLLVANKPALKLRVDALAAQLTVAQADMALLVELRRHDGFAAAQQRMIDGGQRERMDQLRAVILELDEEEQRQAQGEQHGYVRASSALINLAFFGLCGALLVTAGLGVFIRARLNRLTRTLGTPLREVSRELRAAAKAALRDAANLAEFAKDDAEKRAEGQATLDVITRMAKDLSAVAMEITSSVRVFVERPEEGQQEVYAAQLDRLIALAGRIAQSALSLELTTAEQRRTFDGSGLFLQQLELSVKNVAQAASRVRRISRDLMNLLQGVPRLVGRSSAAAALLDGSDVEISPIGL